MKRVKNSDIKFKINKKLVYLPNFVIRFYTVNQKEYFFEKTQDDLVEYEREATVDDVEVILSGGTTVTEYYLPLNWSELLFVGQGILNYKLTNNIEDPEFPDYQYNKEEVVTTDFYIDSIKVNPEPEEGLIERVVHLEEHLAEEIVNREEADTALQEAIDAETNRATSAETHLQTEITELSGTVATYDDRITRAQEDARQAFEQTEAEIARSTAAEAALDTKIDQEIADRIADVNAEEARAISAETALDTKIDAETNRATSAETALQTAINDEATARANADTALQTAITNEESRAREAESGITNSLNAEVTRATGAEAALDAKIDTVSGNVITEEARAKGVEDILSGAIDTIDAKFIDDAKYEMSGQTHVINFYNGNVVKATIDCTDFLVDGMIDNVYIENGYLVIDFNTASGKQDIRIPLTDIFNPANYYTKSETSGATEIANALALKLNISDFNTYSGNVATALGEKAAQSTVDALSGTVNGHISDSTIHLTSGNVQTQIDNSISSKANSSDVYLKTETSGATEIATALAQKLAISDFNTYSGAVDTTINSKASQSDLEVISGTVEDNEEVTAEALNVLNEALSGKADSSDVYLKSETSGATEIATALAAKQDQLIAGENIIISGNVISSEGGGGKAIEAGRGISITTGETADTVSFNLPISAGTGVGSIIGGRSGNIATPQASFAFGEDNRIEYDCAYASIYGYGNHIYAGSTGAHIAGVYNEARNGAECAVGKNNVSNTGSTNADKTLFSVGNGTNNNNRHNAFEIRQNGDIYLTKDGQDVKLQDQLGGGGGGTVESAITSGSTNAVESKAIWSATTYNKDVLLTFNGYDTTNYPQGCTKIKVEVVGSYNNSTIDFYNDWTNLGHINVRNFGSISVDTTNFQGATYEISGTTVIISYPTVTNVTKINASDNGNYVYKAVVEGAWIADNTYMKEEVDAIQNTLQNNINQKLDATAYTPTVVDSSLNVASTNPVQNQALYSELRIGNGGETETTIEWSGSDSTNYPQGCTKIKVENITNYNTNTIDFNGDNWTSFGKITINNWGSITVTNNFDGATYEISGSTVIISYPTVTTVTKLNVSENGRYTYKAITTEPPTVLKDQVVANTAALATKQNQLTAGSGISIDASNVISVTGGTGGGISSAECQTMIDQSISGKTNQTDFVSHSGNTSIHVTTAQTAVWDAKSDFSGSYYDLTDKPTIPNYTAGSGITISNNVISAKIWSGTQAQYDALTVKDNDTIYLIYNS